jgi:hypothetical protein
MNPSVSYAGVLSSSPFGTGLSMSSAVTGGRGPFLSAARAAWIFAASSRCGRSSSSLASRRSRVSSITFSAMFPGSKRAYAGQS